MSCFAIIANTLILLILVDVTLRCAVHSSLFEIEVFDTGCHFISGVIRYKGAKIQVHKEIGFNYKQDLRLHL